MHANPQAVALWTDWLNAGYRITAIGGNDYHEPVPKPGEDKPPERLGLPSTYVYAEELSGAAILEGLRRRRAYVSMGARVTFQAQADGRAYEIGADTGRLAGAAVFSGTVTDCPDGARVQIVRDSTVVAERESVGGDVAIEWEMHAEAEEPAWVRLDVYDPEGLMIAVTNPIFFGPHVVPDQVRYGDFVDSSPLVSE